MSKKWSPIVLILGGAFGAGFEAHNWKAGVAVLFAAIGAVALSVAILEKK